MLAILPEAENHPVKTVYTEKHKLRDAKTELSGGLLKAPFECPARAEIIRRHVEERGLGEILAPREHGLDPVRRVHDEGLLRFLETGWDMWVASGAEGELLPNVWPGRSMPSRRIPTDIEGLVGYYALAGETAISPGTWEAALASKDVALTALDLVLAGERAAFGLCRPPGHHASTDQYGGYCFINNAAVAAQAALDRGAGRVSILDVDFHHGNGTQEIFYRRGDVQFLSLHGDPLDAFPHFLGHADETGEGAGEGTNLNFPMPRGTGFDSWSEALDRAVAEVGRFRPDLLIVSLGVDTFERDPISFFKLASDDFTRYGETLARMRLPTLFVMEGGYAVEEIGLNTVNVLSGFASV